jgi:hypothetical protein
MACDSLQNHVCKCFAHSRHPADIRFAAIDAIAMLAAQGRKGKSAMRRSRIITVLMLSACVRTIASAEEAPPVPHQEGPGYTIVRYDEDCSYLKSAPATDFFDPIKYTPLGGRAYLTVGGQPFLCGKIYRADGRGAGTAKSGKASPPQRRRKGNAKKD